MGRYLVRRVLAAVFTLWAVATLFFFLLDLFPGGPFDQDIALNPEFKARLDAVYGVSGPIFQRYFRYLAGCLRGDLGLSLHFPGQTVSEVMGRGLHSSLILNLMAFLLALILGFTLGILPHLRPGVPALWRAASRIGLSLPALFFAPLLLWLFCFRWDLFPLRADGSPSSFVLPVFLLGFRPACGLARLLDLKLSENRSQDFARTFLSLGASENRLVWRWLLRSSLVTFLQQIPQIAAALIVGSLLIEPLFGVQGLGMQSVESLLNRDWPLAMGITLFFSLILICTQWASDALMLALDPRTRFH